jgi:hypothetical protein
MSDEDAVRLKPACRHLRHKMMYVDERHSRVGLVDDSSDTRVFFCVLSQDPLGQDGEPVSPDHCTPARGCYCSSDG